MLKQHLENDAWPATPTVFAEGSLLHPTSNEEIQNRFCFPPATLDSQRLHMFSRAYGHIVSSISSFLLLQPVLLRMSFFRRVYICYESSENHGEKFKKTTAQKHPEARHFRSFQHSKHVRLEPRLQFEGGLTATTGADET